VGFAYFVLSAALYGLAPVVLDTRLKAYVWL
jgi:hypothetical protein